ncbi:MAG: energy coupling factor transporter S component ThiW [Candidatus Bathyarchaeota archaeon]|nr:MAG: energy coupling factor transporter S component ThiW [Candidatus Bathyarchaeota archaeon]
MDINYGEFSGAPPGLVSNLEDKASASERREPGGAISTKKIAFSAVMVAVTVVLSPFYIPLGTTKCFPAQHMVNGILGVLVGPWYAALMALATGVVRNVLNMGTLYAFPGGIPGAVVVGLTHRYVKRTDLAAIAEPLGTVAIGATLSALILAPMQGHPLTMYFFWAAFAASSIPGSVLGFVILKALRGVGFARYFDE